jgi:hypothetical protein
MRIVKPGTGTATPTVRPPPVGTIPVKPVRPKGPLTVPSVDKPRPRVIVDPIRPTVLPVDPTKMKKGGSVKGMKKGGSVKGKKGC